MRLIDADALMQEYARFVAPSNNSDFEDVPTWNDAVSLLGSAPTIEPQRMRWKWIPQGWNDTYCKCSRCDAVYVTAEIPYNYCPNCGTDMRGTE